MYYPYGDSKQYIDVSNGLGKKYRCYLPEPPPEEEIKNFELPKEEQVWRRTELPILKAREIDFFLVDKEYKPEDEITWDEAIRQESIKQTGLDPWAYSGRKDSKKIIPEREIDPDYTMEVLQEFRESEWKKCFGDPETGWPGGEYIFIRGKLVYLTRFNYFYINYWKLNTGFAEFRITDTHNFYLWQYVITHPRWEGMNELTQRGQGKSYRSGSIGYLTSISYDKCHVGIQSKTDKDAEYFFDTKVSEPYKDLPNYLIPIHRHSSDPKKGLYWSPKGTTGTNREFARREADKALRSMLDFRSSKDGAYDNATLKLIIHEEAGKVSTDSGNIQKGIGIVRDSVFRDGKQVGKQYASTTVEDMVQGGGDNYKVVWLKGKKFPKLSDGSISELSESKLLNVFLRAEDCTYFDQYGYPVVHAAKKYQVEYLLKTYGEDALLGGVEFHKRRKKELEGDHIEWVGYCQRHPSNDKDAFMIKGQKCIYNAAILQANQKKLLTPGYDPIVKGDFDWIEVDKSVRFVPNPSNGAWEASWLFEDPERHANKVDITHTDEGILVAPQNDINFAMGVDPFRAKTTQSKKGRSNTGAAVYRKLQVMDPEFSDTFVADYVDRPPDPDMCWEQMIMACVYFGCKVLCENQVDHMINHFFERGYGAFIMYRPPSTNPKNQNDFQATPGIPSSDPVIQNYINKTKSHVQVNGHKLKQPRINDNWLEFDPEKRTKFDLGVAASITLLAADNPHAVDYDPEVNKVNLNKLLPNFN